MAGIAYHNIITTGHSTAPPTRVVTEQDFVFISGRPVVLDGDKIVPHAYHDDPPHDGSVIASNEYVRINGIKVGQVGDPISCGDTISEGSEFVFME